MERETRSKEELPAEEFGGGAGDAEEGAAGAGTGFDSARGWRLAAYAFLAAAAALLLMHFREAAFFAAALDVSAWFLNVRAGLKRKHDLVKDGARNWRPRRDVRDFEEE